MQDSVGGVKGRGPIRYSRVSGGQGVFRQKRSQFSRISPYGKVFLSTIERSAHLCLF